MRGKREDGELKSMIRGWGSKTRGVLLNESRSHEAGVSTLEEGQHGSERDARGVKNTKWEAWAQGNVKNGEGKGVVEWELMEWMDRIKVTIKSDTLRMGCLGSPTALGALCQVPSNDPMVRRDTIARW